MSLRERKKLETEQAICQAAGRLFAERGYAGTRTRDIAEAAGIATGTLFNYAPTKEAVVLLLWKDRAQAAAQAGLAAAAQEADPVDACVALFRPIFAFYAEDLELGRVFLKAAALDNADDPGLQAINAGFIGDIVRVLLPTAGRAAPFAAGNVFAAYYLTVTGLLIGQVGSVDEACLALRMLVQTQRAGWAEPAG